MAAILYLHFGRCSQLPYSVAIKTCSLHQPPQNPALPGFILIGIKIVNSFRNYLNKTNSGKSLSNIHVGDLVHCYIAGWGFVGIGKCTSTAVPMDSFFVDQQGQKTNIKQVPWINESAKSQLDSDMEIFIGVEWLKYVDDPADGYWEKGLVSVPLVAYMLSDKTTHQKVQEHFQYKPDSMD